MSKHATDAQGALQDLAGFMASMLERLPILKRNLARLSEELIQEKLDGVKFRSELADCKAELAEKAAGAGPDMELLRDFVKTLSGDCVGNFASRHGHAGWAAGPESLGAFHVRIARAILAPHPKGLKAWLAEFYPVSAKDVPKERAARESLWRWRGQTPEVLAAYGLTKQPDLIVFGDGKEDFCSGHDVCPLCRHFRTYGHGEQGCSECVLRHILGAPCFECDQSYGIWKHTGNAGPMIAALEEAVELEDQRYGKVAVVSKDDAAASGAAF